MDKKSYLEELFRRLRELGVGDAEEIVAEYDEHFKRKVSDGYTEEEVASRLERPEEVARQFAEAESAEGSDKAARVAARAGLLFADIFAAAFFALMYAWVAVLGAFSLSCAVLGVCLFAKPLLPEGFLFIPYVPYVGGAMLGVASLSLGALAGVLTVYAHALTRQVSRAYSRWHRNIWSGEKYPPLDKHPALEDKLRRRLRSVAVVSLAVLGVSFTLGYVVLASSAGALGFWHVWHWFE